MMNGIYSGNASVSPIDIALDELLTTPEILYLIAMNNKMVYCFREGCQNIYLSGEDYAQNGFRNWVDHFWSVRQISVEKPSEQALDLTVILPSIWDKVRNYIENQMVLNGDAAGIADERECLQRAEFERLREQEGPSGRVFTCRQTLEIFKAMPKCLDRFGSLRSGVIVYE